MRPFTQSVSYGFKGTCEHVALSLCDSLSATFVVTVDFLTESMENGAIGVFLDDLHWISREDGSFDDGDLEVQAIGRGDDFTRHIYSAGVEVDFHANRTVIKFRYPNAVEVVITHNYGKNLICLCLNSCQPAVDISMSYTYLNFYHIDSLC